MQILRSHWFWFFAILTVLSGLDYWDHIARPGSRFEADKAAWFGFTAASHVTVCAIAYGIARAGAGLSQRYSIPQIVIDTLGFAVAVAMHLLVTGPLWDKLFWFDELMFDGVLVPVLVAAAFYLFYRGIFAFLSMLRFKPASKA